MGNFVNWFERSYKGIIVVLIAVMAATLVVLAMQHVNSSRADAGATPHPIPTFTSGVSERTRVAVIGDSYTACSDMGGCGQSNYTRKLARDLQLDLQTFAVGGTGYVNNSGGKTTFGDRVGDVVKFKPDVVIVEGGRNDAALLQQLPAAASETLGRIKSQIPAAKLVVVGPIRTESSIAGESFAHDAVIAAAQSVGADVIVDPVADGWFAGGDAKYIGADKTHPTDAGHAYMAERLESSLKSLLS